MFKLRRPAFFQARFFYYQTEQECVDMKAAASGATFGHRETDPDPVLRYHLAFRINSDRYCVSLHYFLLECEKEIHDEVPHPTWLFSVRDSLCSPPPSPHHPPPLKTAQHFSPLTTMVSRGSASRCFFSLHCSCPAPNDHVQQSP